MKLFFIFNIFVVVNIGTTTYGCPVFAVNESTQIMTSPNFPYNYPDNYACSKLFVNSNKGQIEFRVTQLHLENHATCNFDYLKVYDGRDANSPLLRTFCGSASGVLRSSGRALYAMFKTDSSVPSSGFSVSVSNIGIPRKGVCTGTIECLKSLTCVNGVCDCKNQQFYNESSEMCTERLKAFSQCNTTWQCQDSLACLDGICKCLPDHYLRTPGDICEKRISRQSECNETIQCLNSLTCVNGVCDCNSQQFYNESSEICTEKLPAFSPCNTTWQCQDSLACLDGICKCLPDHYLRTPGDICEKRISRQSVCNETTQCLNSLTCVNGVCDCNSQQFYNESSEICTERLQAFSPCNTTSQCQDSLACLGGICKCLPDHYLRTPVDICEKRVHLFSTCSLLSQCVDTLVCINGSCTCALENYWESDTFTCKSKLGVNSNCNTSFQCYGKMECVDGFCSKEYYLPKLKINIILLCGGVVGAVVLIAVIATIVLIKRKCQEKVSKCEPGNELSLTKENNLSHDICSYNTIDGEHNFQKVGGDESNNDLFIEFNDQITSEM